MTNYLTPTPPICKDEEYTNKSAVLKHATNFKTPSPPFLVDVINVWPII